jgi:hypothetical protein
MKIFPCVAGGKAPALPGDWRSHATDDEAQIEAWLDAGYNLAVDCGASNLAVIDLDGGEIGEASWRSLQAKYGDAPSTYEVRTPRGGRHLYFVGEIPNSVQKLAPKVDTRGVGGYVLIPPSVVDGKPYTVETEVLIQPLPAWPSTALRALDRTVASVEGLDQPQNINRAVTYLANVKPGIEGEGGDDFVIRVANHVMDLGVSQEKCLEIMLLDWNERCLPPWEPDDLAVKVSNAARYRQNEIGAWGVAPASELFTGALDKLPDDAEAGVTYKYKLWTPQEALSLPPPEWLIPGILLKRCLCVPYGQQEMGKTFWVLDLALHVASGIAGHGRPEQEAQDVIFFSGEGFDDLVHNRITAWCAAHGCPLGQLRLHLLEDFPNVTEEDDFIQFLEDIYAQLGPGVKPAMVVLDTYARVMAQGGLDENKPLDIMRLVHQAEVMKRGWECAVCIIHHTGKDEARGPRGGNALIAAVDVAWEVKAHWEHKAFEVTCGKMKAAPRPTEPLYYEGYVPQGGRSLVLRSIDAHAFRDLTTVQGGISPRAVGQALFNMGAVGEAGAVTTGVLASELYAGAQDEPPEERQEHLDRLVRQLRTAAKDRLEMYTKRSHDGLKWFVPG